MRNRNIIAIVALLALIAWGGYDYQAKKRHTEGAASAQQAAGIQEGIAVGNRAPDFELQSLEGKPVKLSDFKGKKVLLNFWATWCPPCRTEMPHMEKFYKEFQNADTVVLAVNLTMTEKSADDVPKFVDAFGLTFPVVKDEKGEVSGNYEVMAYPTSYIIDSQGIIRDKFQGAINYEIMRKSFSKLN
ncbi:TlpA disulfide reductase family protein [Paenibacillus chondroitinus]|uniref:TlpA disulfide reductase family protein n=1 Tax=Paenibacillus chondroitinus TaxID=59842 RepID=A0ABU6DKZ1_9BACL|nr:MULTISPECIES: TlpA disulfide reductase family protein [Paenibacillus]MCY9657166.1 TlpA family protein disulfide reductase [Paenibacillus anseongense]MEB4798449.1 TlpA disulfide reductase family protein [Paenibacillus chondroitinus]